MNHLNKTKKKPVVSDSELQEKLRKAEEKIKALEKKVDLFSTKIDTDISKILHFED